MRTGVHRRLHQALLWQEIAVKPGHEVSATKLTRMTRVALTRGCRFTWWIAIADDVVSHCRCPAREKMVSDSCAPGDSVCNLQANQHQESAHSQGARNHPGRRRALARAVRAQICASIAERQVLRAITLADGAPL